MPFAVTLLMTIHYPATGSWVSKDIRQPDWADVEAAIQRMDNHAYPVVALSCTGYEDDEDALHLVGGPNRFALFQACGPWQYEDPTGRDDEVRLWTSDQGYVCRERNLCSMESALAHAKTYMETGSYDALRALSAPS